MVNNSASGRVPEKRGFVREAVHKKAITKNREVAGRAIHPFQASSVNPPDNILVNSRHSPGKVMSGNCPFFFLYNDMIIYQKVHMPAYRRPGYPGITTDLMTGYTSIVQNSLYNLFIAPVAQSDFSVMVKKIWKIFQWKWAFFFSRIVSNFEKINLRNIIKTK